MKVESRLSHSAGFRGSPWQAVAGLFSTQGKTGQVSHAGPGRLFPSSFLLWTADLSLTPTRLSPWRQGRSSWGTFSAPPSPMGPSSQGFPHPQDLGALNFPPRLSQGQNKVICAPCWHLHFSPKIPAEPSASSLTRLALQHTLSQAGWPLGELVLTKTPEPACAVDWGAPGLSACSPQCPDDPSSSVSPQMAFSLPTVPILQMRD